MDEKTLVSTYIRAIKFAKSRGYFDIATEFASWLIIKQLEGTNLNQPMEFSFIDFSRMELGHKNRNIYKFLMNQNKNFSYDFDRFKSNNKLSPEDLVSIVETLNNLLTPLEQEWIKLYVKDGMAKQEIAKLFGVSAGLVTQRLKSIFDKFEFKPKRKKGCHI